MLGSYLDNVRQAHPLIHNITNDVTINDVANVLLATGASPIMTAAPEEVEEIQAIANALTLNIGTLTLAVVPSMERAGAAANERQNPIVLDPVGAGATKLRTETAQHLVRTLRPTVIRGNMSEIQSLVHGKGKTRGVDVGVDDAVHENNLEAKIAFVENFAQDSGSIVAVTGAIDIVSDGKKTFTIRNGRPEMGLVTGTGCQLSALVAAFVAANPSHPLEATTAAVGTMGLAGEIAWERMQSGDGNATYRSRIIDAISLMDGATLDKGVNLHG